MGGGKWAVVVPTNRPERFQEWYRAWKPLLEKHDAALFVIWDLAKAPVSPGGYCDHRDILDFIPRGTDMIRSWGIYKAWLSGNEYTLSLDDDVLPLGDPFGAYERVFKQGATLSRYLNVGALTTAHTPMRGFPFRDRAPAEVAVQYGGWDGVLDYDAVTQLNGVSGEHAFSWARVPVPHGVPVTCCAMNMAWRTEYAPIMWQLPLIDGKYNRFGDIWSGLFQKATLDALRKVMVVNGAARVSHDRASDPFTNLEREAPGLKINEDLWAYVSRHDGDGLPKDIYRAVTDAASCAFPAAYREGFLNARDEWLALF